MGSLVISRVYLFLVVVAIAYFSFGSRYIKGVYIRQFRELQNFPSLPLVFGKVFPCGLGFLIDDTLALVRSVLWDVS